MGSDYTALTATHFRGFMYPENLGPVAQLGERFAGSEEVGSSSLPGSNHFPHALRQASRFLAFIRALFCL